MKIIELILDEEQDDIGVEAISIVESPAIESDFVALKNQEIKLAEVDKEKKILMGALLIPDKPIYRNGGQGEYYIFFSKDTIVKASQMFQQVHLNHTMQFCLLLYLLLSNFQPMLNHLMLGCVLVLNCFDYLSVRTFEMLLQ